MKWGQMANKRGYWVNNRRYKAKGPIGFVCMANPLITVTTVIFVKGEQLNCATK